jgi:hypothetical protein
VIDDDLLLEVGLAPDVGALQCLVVRAAQQLGFGMASGARILGRLASGRATVQSFGNPPDGFAEASKSLDLGLRDPLLGRLLGVPGLVAYNQSFYVDAGAGDLADLLAPFGYREGLAFSIHESAHAEVFFFGVDGPDRLPANPAALIELQAMLQLLTVHAQAAMQQIAIATRPAALPLAEVERECLRWEAAGNVWRAGEVLHLSDAQLQRTVRSAANKLGASTPRAAAVHALRSGQIKS